MSTTNFSLNWTKETIFFSTKRKSKKCFFGSRDSFKAAGYSKDIFLNRRSSIYLGAWATDKPKGWHELPPA
jgi:hypothetical protein